MRSIILILTVVVFAASAVLGQDKKQRDSNDKKEQKQGEQGTKLDKIKDKLSKKSNQDEDNDYDSDDSFFPWIVVDLWWDINKGYHYTPYPYHNNGLLGRDSSSNRPLHFEAALSAFAGGSNITAINFSSKLKLYTLFGVEFQYNGFTEDDLLDSSNMKMYRFNGAVNILSHPYGLLELKFGGWNITDVGTGPSMGFQADIAPIYPVMLNFRVDLAEINGHDIADYAFTLGFIYKRVEFFSGYRIYDMSGEIIDGPVGGITTRF